MNEALKKAQEAMRRKREAGEEIERLDPVQKWRKNPKSWKNIVRAMCWQCSGESRQEIKKCTMKDTCPAWASRAYQSK